MCTFSVINSSEACKNPLWAELHASWPLLFQPDGWLFFTFESKLKWHGSIKVIQGKCIGFSGCNRTRLLVSSHTLAGFHVKTDYLSVLGWESQYWQCWGCGFACVVQWMPGRRSTVGFFQGLSLGLRTALECSVRQHFPVLFLNEWLQYKNLIQAIEHFQYNIKLFCQ